MARRICGSAPRGAVGQVPLRHRWIFLPEPWSDLRARGAQSNYPTAAVLRVAEAGDGFADGVEDLDVTAAAAKIAAEVVADLFVGRSRVFGEERFGAEDDAGGAVGALEAGFGEERFLHRVEMRGCNV